LGAGRFCFVVYFAAPLGFCFAVYFVAPLGFCFVVYFAVPLVSHVNPSNKATIPRIYEKLMQIC